MVSFRARVIKSDDRGEGVWWVEDHLGRRGVRALGAVRCPRNTGTHLPMMMMINDGGT